ncbi:MAG TPA: NADH-quinone oxidoreductase subunit J [Chthoniobacteraceae bacterium]|jgi:NADH-quinone oxidoreductase subunit J|nr:NADH-quinone oxidoreductase subunit J [Chthoniobacteraceae bacterium]
MNPGIPFILIAALTLSGALAAAILPNLVHAALSLVLAFVGLAAFYFLLGAEFIGLVQVIVYIGAVAVLIVFTILLTRPAVAQRGDLNWGGVLVAIAVMSGLLWALARTALPANATAAAPMTVMRVGQTLMGDYVWPLQTVGIVLTAALIGAVVLVMEEDR